MNLKRHIKDLIITILILAVTTGTGILFSNFGFTEANIITIYLLAVLLTSLFTTGLFFNVLSSLISVLLFNFFFTEPKLTFHAYEHGYPVTFVIMLTAGLITGTLAGKLKNHARQSEQSAFRTKVLFDTNQLLHTATSEEEIISITAAQLKKLLDRHITAHMHVDHIKVDNTTNASHLSTSTSPTDGVVHFPISLNQKTYGTIGILIDNRPLDSLESSILLAILGECALAIENIRNVKAKEAAAMLAQKEQLRANLLRAISHDLRTPLTSILGNASNLMSNSRQLDDATILQMYNDIYDDSTWLINLVENLLSITRLEEGRLNFNMTTELMDEVIEEALRHVNRKKTNHNIIVEYKDELLLAKMDARLILQVILNIVDNAIKYTPSSTEIHITAGKIHNKIYVSIADNGTGIPDNLKQKVFEMFFTGENKIVDSRRSLGLGLPLCKSIINAHDGELTLTDNTPQGCIFTFTLNSGEVVNIE